MTSIPASSINRAHFCLIARARRRVVAFAHPETLAELQRVVDEIGFKARHSPYAILNCHTALAYIC